MTVSANQLAKFRSLLGSTIANDTIAPNYRTIQALNDRTLYDCQSDIDAEYVNKMVMPLNPIMVLCIAIVCFSVLIGLVMVGKEYVSRLKTT